MPALGGSCWIFVMMIDGLLAQKALERQKWNLRTGFSLKMLTVPNFMVYVAVVTGLCGTFAPAPLDYIGANLCILLSLPFFFNGLAVVHAWAATTRFRMIILLIFYSVITVAVALLFLVAILGVVDQWVNFRQRFTARTKQS
jgi:uncharacterized protein YybS (DUF2232 family)